jgi:maleate isomerase
MSRPPDPGPMYGWRARIGIIQPGFNPHHAHEFYMMVPDGVSMSLTPIHSVEDPQHEFLSPESLELVIRRIPAAARELASKHVSVIVQAGVPHTTAFGRGIEERIQREVGEVTDLPLIIDVRACIEAIHALQMRKVLIVSPFTDHANGVVADYVRPDGIDVVASYRVRGDAFGGLNMIPMGHLYDQVKEAYRKHPNVDGIWMPGAGMPSVAVIDVLERDLGVPVLSSKQVMVWAALRSARVSDPVEGYGRLFSI